MGRHLDLRAPGLLEALVALACAGGLAWAALTSSPVTGSVPQAEVEERAARQQVVAQGRAPGVAEVHEPSADAGGASDPRPDPEPTPEPEPAPAPVEPAALAAGATLTAEEVARAGGADAFFWAEEVGDATFARMEGKSFGPDCTVPRSDLRYLRVLHMDAEGTIMVGELVVHRNVADEVVDIFRQLYDAGYPIRKMRLVDDYDADDDRSCADDNTSAFNYRVIAGTSTLSNHAYGLAIDINTFENPYCKPYQDYVSPPEAWRYADRSLREPYMIHTDDLCYQLFTQHGWSWGGNWETPKDYQHFEKPDARWQ